MSDFELVLAASNGDATEVERLISEKADVNFRVCFVRSHARVVFLFVR